MKPTTGFIVPLKRSPPNGENISCTQAEIKQRSKRDSSKQKTKKKVKEKAKTPFYEIPHNVFLSSSRQHEGSRQNLRQNLSTDTYKTYLSEGQ